MFIVMFFASIVELCYGFIEKVIRKGALISHLFD